MKRRKFFSAFAALGAAPAIAVAKAMSDDPLSKDENGDITLKGNIKIEGSMKVLAGPGQEYALVIENQNVGGVGGLLKATGWKKP